MYQQGVVPTRMMVMGVRRKLPYDAEVEYLEWTGTQWVDSGIVPDSTTDAEIECAYDWAPGIILTMFCGGVTYHNNEFGVILNANSESGTGAIIYEKSRTTDVRKRGGAAALSGVFCNYRIIGSTAYFGTTTIGTFRDTNISTTNSVYIGATHRNGIVGGEPFDGKIRYCKLWKSGVLVRDFISVRKGTVGYLYDRANPTGGPSGNGLYGSATATPLVAGPDKSA